MMTRDELAAEAKGFSKGAITPKDWSALCRTMCDVWGEFQGYPPIGWFVEVGTLGGQTTRGILEVLKFLKWSEPKLVTIDTDEACLGQRLSQQCAGFPNKLERFNGKAEEWDCDEEPIWWAFIDGCHCHDCVLSDLKALGPRVPAGGVICLHDAGRQRQEGMLVYERYHNDGKDRLYGVTSAFVEWGGGDGVWVQVESVPAKKRSRGAPTKLFGGLWAFKRTK